MREALFTWKRSWERRQPVDERIHRVSDERQARAIQQRGRRKMDHRDRRTDGWKVRWPEQLLFVRSFARQLGARWR